MLFNKMCQELKVNGFEYVGEYFDKRSENVINASFKILDYNEHNQLDYIIYVSFTYYKKNNELSLSIDCDNMSSYIFNCYEELIRKAIESTLGGFTNEIL